MNGKQAQPSENKLEKLLINMAKAKLPDYEGIRNNIVERFEINELNSYKPTTPLAKSMLPIVKLYKCHSELTEEFNNLWSPGSRPVHQAGYMAGIGKAKGKLRDEPVTILNISRHLPAAIRNDISRFIWFPWKVKTVEGKKTKVGDSYKYSAAYWVIDDPTMTESEIEKKSNRAYWARIAVYEYLLKYEVDPPIQLFIIYIGMAGSSSSFPQEFKGAYEKTGDILMPYNDSDTQNTDDAVYLYWTTIMSTLLKNMNVIDNNNIPSNDELTKVCLRKIVDSKAINSIEVLDAVRKIAKDNENKLLINTVIKDLEDLKIPNSMQIDWINILK